MAQDVERATPLTTRTATATTTAPAARPGATVHTLALDANPTRITLRTPNAPADAVLGQLCEAAGIVYRSEPQSMWPEGSPTIQAIDFRDEPFWSALLSVCRQTGTRPVERGFDPREAPTITVTRSGAATPIAVDGPLLFRIQQIERRASIQYGGADDDEARTPDSLAVTLQIQPEPRLRMYAIGSSLQVERADDETGKSLLPTVKFPMSPRGELLGNTTNMLRLDYPRGAGKRLAVFRGRIDLYVPQRIIVADIPNPLDEKQAEAGVPIEGGTITVKPIGTGRDASLEVTVRRGESTDEQTWVDMSAGMNMFPNRLTLQGPNGEYVPWGSISGSSYSGEFLRVRRSLGATSQRAASLRIEIPVNYKMVPTTFEFRDVPLP